MVSIGVGRLRWRTERQELPPALNKFKGQRIGIHLFEILIIFAASTNMYLFAEWNMAWRACGGASHRGQAK